MFGPFILLLPCFLMVVPTSNGKPLQIDKIKLLIHVARFKIQKEIEGLNMPQNIQYPLPEVIPGKTIQGLWSVIDVLRSFQVILDIVWGQSSEFKRNLSKDFNTLQGHLNRWTVSLKCPAREENSLNDLEDYLRENQRFNLTLVPKLLQRFNDYMNLFRDANIETC